MLHVNKKMSKLDLIKMVKDRKHFSEVEQAEAMLALKKWHSMDDRDLCGYYDSNIHTVMKMLRLASISNLAKIRTGRKSWSWEISSFLERNPKATSVEIIAELDRLECWNGSLQEWGHSHNEFKHSAVEWIYNDIVASIGVIQAISNGKWKVDNEILAVIPLLLKEVLDLYKKNDISEETVKEWMPERNRKLNEHLELESICRRNFCLSLNRKVDLTDSSLKMKLCRDAVAKTLYRTRLQLNEYGNRHVFECHTTKIDTNDIVEACLILADKAMEAISEVF